MHDGLITADGFAGWGLWESLFLVLGWSVCRGESEWQKYVFAWFSQKSQNEKDSSLLFPPVAHCNLPSLYNALSPYPPTSSSREANSRPGAQNLCGVVKTQATTINLHHILPRPF